MKPLKLKKVKISKIGNPHILFGGANAAAAQNVRYPDTTGKDTKQDGDCITGTQNDRTTSRTGAVPLDIAQGGIQN